MGSLRLRLIVTAFALAAPALGAGCSESHTPGGDAEITFDAAGIDGGRDGGVDAYMPACGNGRLEGGEQCDDGNVAPGDGCDELCAREPYCGDGVMDPGEACDDGNHRSGDGCRSDCLSTEVCGNDIVDYVTGELCDGEAGCRPDCSGYEMCPDGTVGPGEVCDDGNTNRWDACGNDCRETVTFVLDSPEFAGRGIGCDYSGDGMPDNQFAVAAGDLISLINMFFGGGGGGGPTFLISMLGLDDPAAVNDPSLRVAWLQGQAAGAGAYQVSMGSLNPDGSPSTSLESSISARALMGGPEDLEFPVAFLPLELRDARILGTTVATSGRVSRIDNGMVCGAVPLDPLSFLNETLVESFGSMGGFTIDIPPACDGTSEPSTLVDWMIGGANLLVARIRATPPDVDLDGDGLETFELTGGTGCQPVVTACIDGDGTRIEGRGCYSDPRIADGYSAALLYTATRVTTTGVAP